jgi:OOP family OmpA-OmpF porin
MKNTRQKNLSQVLSCITLTCCVAGMAHADIWKQKENTEAYTAPPKEGEFAPFGDEKSGPAVESQSETVSASDYSANDSSNTSSYYFGADLGPTFLKPDVDGTAYSNEKNNDIGFGVLGGFYWSPRGRIEAQYHKLGAAEVGLSGVNTDVDYDVFNFDLAYDLWQSANSQIFASIGLTALDTSSAAPIEKENSTGVKLGAGYEFFLNDDWSTRIAYNQFSGDAGMLSLGLNRHFGRNTQPAPVVVATPEPMPALEPIVMRAIAPQDNDQDGVINDQDGCPDTLANLKVDNRGCSIVFDRSFPEVNFEFNSTKLTTNAQRILDEVAYELKKVPDQRVEVQAHTDAIGSDFYNIWLSNKRAESIVSYLVLHGIAEAKLIPKGYGETMPVASNSTDSGRAQNRRAEFKLVQ